jgi:hypothetical protein
MHREDNTLEELSVSVTRYYDSLTDEKIADDRAWGDLAAKQWVDEAQPDRL